MTNWNWIKFGAGFCWDFPQVLPKQNPVGFLGITRVSEPWISVQSWQSKTGSVRREISQALYGTVNGFRNIIKYWHTVTVGKVGEVKTSSVVVTDSILWQLDITIAQQLIIPRGRHSEGLPFPGPLFSAISSTDNLRLGLGLGQVRVSRLVVAISRTISCNDHEWRLSEWWPLGVPALRNGGSEPINILHCLNTNNLHTYHLLSPPSEWSEWWRYEGWSKSFEPKPFKRKVDKWTATTVV